MIYMTRGAGLVNRLDPGLWAGHTALDASTEHMLHVVQTDLCTGSGMHGQPRAQSGSAPEPVHRVRLARIQHVAHIQDSVHCMHRGCTSLILLP